jgi:hypothetical protein
LFAYLGADDRIEAFFSNLLKMFTNPKLLSHLEALSQHGA